MRRANDGRFAELGGLFDDGVVLLTTAIAAVDVDALSPNEAAIVAHAVGKRRREFATGRAVAREAVSRFGIVDVEILRDSNGAPIWPHGIAGSIAHCNTHAFAAVGRRDEVRALGIDAEDGPGLAMDLWPIVLDGKERELIERLDLADRERVALVTFSAKEALYKAKYAITGAFMDFHDLRVEVLASAGGSPFEGSFACEFRRDVGSFARGHVVSGRFRALRAGGAVVAAVQVREEPGVCP